MINLRDVDNLKPMEVRRLMGKEIGSIMKARDVEMSSNL